MTERDRIDKLMELLQRHKVPLDSFPLGWLMSTDFFRAPASTRFHGAYEGGLFDHSMNVTHNLLYYRECGLGSEWSRPESPIIVGMLHDAVKINAYRHYIDYGPKEDFFFKNPWHKPALPIHGAESVRVVESHTKLTPEEELCIRFHMGAYETNDWEAFDQAIRQYPNVLCTHTADMQASKLQEG